MAKGSTDLTAYVLHHAPRFPVADALARPSLESVEPHVSRRRALAWLSVAYSGVAFVAVMATARPTAAVWLIAATPCALLGAAYLLSAWAVGPVDIACDPQVIWELRAARSEARRRRNFRIRVATATAIAACAASTVSLMALVAGR